MKDRREIAAKPDRRGDSAPIEGCAALNRSSAAVIVNADDWGRDRVTTDRTLECAQHGAISSVSGMVFMQDSERAAALSRLHGIDTGLHLNFTLAFSAESCSSRMKEHQGRIARFLNSHRFATALYHPGLAPSFEYVVRGQLDEFERLYGVPAGRIDGHHHMHICANVMKRHLLPDGIIVRRNLSFRPGEKSAVNRLYRKYLDSRLARRHRQADYFFDLLPHSPRSRLEGIIELAGRFDIELETHPAQEVEYRFLMEDGLNCQANEVIISRGYMLRFSKASRGFEGAYLEGETLR